MDRKLRATARKSIHQCRFVWCRRQADQFAVEVEHAAAAATEVEPGLELEQRRIVVQGVITAVVRIKARVRDAAADIADESPGDARVDHSRR